ncbi:MAG: response regulator [Planctomycetaceae bacterium]|nr:response regulator [Planctomycetota bacterium]NUN51385.1 response regulator [Planctomycetaceae bacterium]
MSLREKILGTLGLAYAGLLLLFFLLVGGLWLRSLEEEERILARREAERVQAAVQDALQRLHRTTEDWAEWDDTYEYAGSGNPEYERDNFTYDALDNLGLDFAAVVLPGGRILRAASVDRVAEALAAPPAGLEKAFRPGGPFPDVGRGVTGLLALEEGPCLVCALPILTSRDQGPPRGLLVFGTRLDSSRVSELGDRLLLRTEVLPPGGAAAGGPGGEPVDPVSVEVVDTGNLHGLLRLADVEGRPCAVLRVVLPRTHAERGRRALLVLLTALLAAALLLGVLVRGILDRWILARLRVLAAEAREIRGGRKAGGAPPPEGEDEVGTATRVIREAMESLEESERALAASESRYRALFDASPVPQWVYDPVSLRFLAVNDAAVAHYGYPREEFLAMRAPDLWPDEDAGVREARIGSLLRVGSPAPRLVRHRRKDGGILEVEVSAALLTLGGAPARLVVAKDVTERSLLQAQLLQSQKMEAVGRLAGGVAHDFNNMLVAILGFSDLALARIARSDPLREYLLSIRQAGERAAGLTRQLLAFSRRQASAKRVLDLDAHLRGMTGMLRRILGEDVELSLVPSAGSAFILADPVQVEQVVLNLAVNARDAMPLGGRLTLEVSRIEMGPDDVGRLQVRSPGPHISLAVTDTGTGMDAATMERIFEPFFTTKPAGKGTGLGLATVYGILKEAGGGIWCRSTPGKGTTFTVCFPLAEAEAGSEGPGPGDPPPGGGERILLVEDEPLVRNLARQALESRGYSVTEASSGEEALPILGGGGAPFALVVSDVVMPGMRGPALAERARERIPGLPFLFMSGYNEDADLDRAVAAGESAFLQKPFAPGDLARRVREILDGRGPSGPFRAAAVRPEGDRKGGM